LPQPFRQANCHTVLDYDFFKIAYRQDHLLLTTNTTYHCLSNGVWNGGMVLANQFVNWKVPLDFDMSDPEDAMKRQLMAWNIEGSHCVGLQTAAKLTHASINQISDSSADASFHAACCVTVGTGNAVRAGQPRETYPAYIPGTVNCIVLIDGRMTESAIANAWITITEAKTAALQDAGICDANNGMLATGTTTDAIVVAVSQAERFSQVHRYAGTATTIGYALEQIIYQAVYTSVVTQNQS
jgi:adenosylcobinamide hydrolase